MPLRVIFLYVVVAALAIYAWRDWFKALCGLILLTAVLEHSDMPKTIMGIQGLNLWNVLFLIIVISWLTSRQREKLTWDAPRHLNILLLGYLAVFLIAFARMIFDRSAMIEAGYTFRHLVSERLINTIKWVFPGLLLFYGCRTPKQLRIAVGCVCVLCFLLALQVVIYMPIGAVTEVGNMRVRRHLSSEIGIHPSNLGKVIAGGAWAIFACSMLLRRKLYRILLLAGFGVMTLAQALVGSRMGYVAWAAIGVTMCLLRWRRYLVLVPLAAVIALAVLPGAADRLMTGFGVGDVAGGTTEDAYSITAGRNVIWPQVVDKISEAPVFGYGRDAMRRTGLTESLHRSAGEGVAVGHAHNAYLSILLESGAVGLLVILAFYAAVLCHSIRLFCLQADPMVAATGGVTLALVASNLLAGMGSQNFFPIEADIPMWCMIGLMLRVLHDMGSVRQFSRMEPFGSPRWASVLPGQFAPVGGIGGQ